MRRNFAQILKENKIDLNREFKRLYDLLHCVLDDVNDINMWGNKTTVYNLIDEKFSRFRFRGTTLSLKEFDDEYGFHFEFQFGKVDIDSLVIFCEYLYNMIVEYERVVSKREFNTELFLQQINEVVEKIEYTHSSQDGLAIFIPKSPEAISVAEIMPQEISYKVLAYNHHSLHGDIEAKKDTILKLANLLEGKRKKLNKINASLEGDLFYAFNNLNMRHNNIDITSKNYKKYVSNMSKQDLENWYDEIYQMCLLAFLELEQSERKNGFDKLKNEIENNK